MTYTHWVTQCGYLYDVLLQDGYNYHSYCTGYQGHVLGITTHHILSAYLIGDYYIGASHSNRTYMSSMHTIII